MIPPWQAVCAGVTKAGARPYITLMDDESPGLGLDLPEQTKPEGDGHYRVLARK